MRDALACMNAVLHGGEGVTFSTDAQTDLSRSHADKARLFPRASQQNNAG